MKTPTRYQKQQSMINQQLKKYYVSLEEETIPDRFIEMLEQLDKAEKKATQAKRKSDNDGK